MLGRAVFFKRLFTVQFTETLKSFPILLFYGKVRNLPSTTPFYGKVFDFPHIIYGKKFRARSLISLRNLGTIENA